MFFEIKLILHFSLAIEGVLFKGLYKAGFILPSNFEGGLSKIGWDRSSRTDKGVHSVSTVISCKLELTSEQEKDLEAASDKEVCKYVNSYLPQNVRILSMQKTCSSFCARFDTLWV